MSKKLSVCLFLAQKLLTHLLSLYPRLLLGLRTLRLKLRPLPVLLFLCGEPNYNENPALAKHPHSYLSASIQHTRLIRLRPLLQLHDIVIEFLGLAVSLLCTALLQIRVIPLHEFFVRGADILDERWTTNAKQDTAVKWIR